MITQTLYYLKYAGVLLCSTLLMFSCSNDEESGAEPDPVDPIVEKTALVLATSATEIDKGDTVTFDVTADGEAVDADIYINNDKINGITHTFEEAGTYTAVAKKDGYTDSEGQIIIVEEQQYQTDIYVAGYESSGYVLMPKYWKNGVPVDLETNPQGGDLYAMTVDGEDIYFAGNTWDSEGLRRIATYWKNGKAVDLTDGSQQARVYAIAVDNGDVYAAGDHAGDPVYWKNGTPIKLRDEIGNEYIAGIAVNGSEVHTVIRRFPQSIHEVGIILYSKNGGTLETLSTNGIAHAIAIDGNDVYVVGNEWNGSNSVAKYWKNGKAVALSNKSVNTDATAITVDGGDVYIAGTETDESPVSKYWKNGKAVVLDQGEYDGAYVAGITVDGDDVYVAGRVWTGSKRKVAYWKNGTLVTLTDGDKNVDAVSIAVVKTPVE